MNLSTFLSQVVLKVLDPSFEIENPYSPYIQGMNCFIFFTSIPFSKISCCEYSLSLHFYNTLRGCPSRRVLQTVQVKCTLIYYFHYFPFSRPCDINKPEDKLYQTPYSWGYFAWKEAKQFP